MKKILLTALVAFATLSSTEMLAQHGFGTNNPDKSAAVDIVSTKRGLLIPRVELTSTIVAAPVTAPANSLLIYNTGSAGDVTPGFYYWEVNKWVRVMSSNIAKTSSVIDGVTTNVTSAVSANNPLNTEYKVEVKDGAITEAKLAPGAVTNTKIASDAITTDKIADGAVETSDIKNDAVTPEKIASGTNKQVLVSKLVDGVLETVWVDYSEIINDGIQVGDGLTKNGNTISLGGDITGLVDLNLIGAGDIKISNLPVLGTTGYNSFDSTNDKIVVMNPDGTLRQASASSIITDAIEDGEIIAKKLTTDGKIVIGTDGLSSLDNAVLVNTHLKIKEASIDTTELTNGAVTNVKLDGGAGEAGRVAVSDANGNVTYAPITSAVGKTLTTDGKIGIGSTGSTTLPQAVLVDTFLKINAGSIGTTELTNNAVTADKIDNNAVTTGKIADDAVTADKINANVAGPGLVQNATGALQVDLVASGIAKGLTTDNVIQITVGADQNSTSSATASVLKDIKLEIGADKITATHIATGAVNSDEIATDAVTAVKIDESVAGSGLDKNTTTGALDVNFEEVSSMISKGLTTDNVIQITVGADQNSTSSATSSVLKDIKLEIGADKITAAHIATGAVTTSEIANGTILTEDIAKGGNSTVLATNATGEVIWMPQADLGNVITADNGLTKIGNNIRLGGELEIPTKITTLGDNTLAIVNLEQVAKVNSIVVAEKDGVLRTTERSISTTTSATLNVSTVSGYSPYVQEVNVSVDLAATNIDINLPEAVAAKGQVISIKLTNTTEVAGYVSIKSGSTELTYGGLPYQGWILKSNGTNWSIVGRN